MVLSRALNYRYHYPNVPTSYTGPIDVLCIAHVNTLLDVVTAVALGPAATVWVCSFLFLFFSPSCSNQVPSGD